MESGTVVRHPRSTDLAGIQQFGGVAQHREEEGRMLAGIGPAHKLSCRTPEYPRQQDLPILRRLGPDERLHP